MLDPLNGEHSIKGYELLKPLGRIVHFGAASITSESRSLMTAFKAWWKCLSVNSIDIVSENKSVSGYHLGYLIGNPAVSKELMTDINILLDLFQSNKIKVKVDSIFPFSKIGDAMKRMHARQNVGKIILKPDSEMIQEDAVNAEQVNITTTSPTPTPTPTVEPVSEPTPAPEVIKENKPTEESEKPKAKSGKGKNAKAKPVVETNVTEDTTKESIATEQVKTESEQNGNAITG